MLGGISSKKVGRVGSQLIIPDEGISTKDNAQVNTSGKYDGISSKQPIARAISFSRLTAADVVKDGDFFDDHGDSMISEANNFEYESFRHKVEWFRQNANTFMSTSRFGTCYRSMYAAVCVFSLFIYCAETYYYHFRFYKVEMAFSAMIFLDWLISLCLADQKLKVLTKFTSTINVISAIPVWITYRTDYPNLYRNLSQMEAFLAVVNALAMTRILRALHINYYFSGFKNAVTKFVAEFACSFFVIIIFHAALMRYLEDKQQLPLHTWIYYVCATSSTVGYGDITPKTTAGRIACMYIIVFSVIFVPKMTNDLLQVMSSQSVYLRTVYLPSWNSEHIIICGDFSTASLRDLFTELFHADHIQSSDSIEVLNAVIIYPGPPTIEMRNILNNSKFKHHLTFIEGSVLNDKDMKRAKAATAVGFFILSDKFSANPDEADANTVLQAFAIRKFINTAHHHSAHDEPVKEPRFVIQRIRPANDLHEPSHKGNSDHNVVVCFNDIKMGIIAKSTVFPGTATLIMNLISSFTGSKPIEINETDEATFITKLNTSAVRLGHRKSVFSVVDEANVDIEAIGSQRRVDWFSEYEDGCVWELYTEVLAPVFDGAKFIDLSFVLQQRSGILLIGLHVLDFSCGLSKVLLNPASFVIPSSKCYEVNAIVIAKNIRDCKQLSQPSPTDLLFFANALRHSKVMAQKEASKSSKRTASSRSLTAETTFIRRQNNQSSLTKISEEFSSVQENLRASAFLTLRSLTHLLPKPRPVEECFVQGSVIDHLPRMSHHIIIVGKDMTHLYDLIRPLRARYLGSVKPIVLLHPDDIPESVWKQISVFPDILVVKGSNLDDEHLIRAGVFRAEQAIILADSKAHQRALGSLGSSVIQAEALVDADAILTYKAIRSLNPRVHIVVEIFNSQNISYLDAHNVIAAHYRSSRPFAAGSIFAAAALDSLVCQAYFNPLIVKIVRKLSTGVDTIDKVDLLTQTLSQELQKAGKESEVVSARKNSILNRVIESSLYSINLPEDTANKTYGNLFQVLAKQSIIPLGLLRSRGAVKLESSLSDCYVYTNPNRSTIVYPSDKIFVLSTVPVQYTVKDPAAWTATSEDLSRLFSTAKLRATPNEALHLSEDKGSQATLESMQHTIKSEIGMMFENQQREFAVQFERLRETIAKVEDLQERLVRETNARQISEADAKIVTEKIASTSTKSVRKHKSPNKSAPAPSDGLLPQVIRSQKMRAGTIDISSYLDFDVDVPIKKKPDFVPAADIARVLPNDLGFLDDLQNNNS